MRTASLQEEWLTNDLFVRHNHLSGIEISSAASQGPCQPDQFKVPEKPEEAELSSLFSKLSAKDIIAITGTKVSMLCRPEYPMVRASPKISWERGSSTNGQGNISPAQ